MRPIGADALKRDICKYCNDVYSDEPCEPSDCEHMRIIDSQPTLDGVEVVRCRDCLYWHEDILACQYLPRSENGTRPAWYGDDFCSYGERKTE